jgi:hypothetical protein
MSEEISRPNPSLEAMRNLTARGLLTKQVSR